MCENSLDGMRITEWTVDYGQGPLRCTVPHTWRQDVDVRWEGPAVYRTSIDVPNKGGWLHFEGVSFEAMIFVQDSLAAEHRGIWDAFKVNLDSYKGQRVEIRVEIRKNGGPMFPVRDVASGFIPYVFHTFGGIWRDVRLTQDEPDMEPAAPPCRVRVDGTKIEVDGRPFSMRGVLTWGWYPELGHPNPTDEQIRREVGIMKDLGFNTVKFCLWIPSHRFLEILEEEGLYAWIELPLWDPSPEEKKQEAIFEELRRIVLQYRRHGNVVAWTCGCELSANTTADYRKRLYEMVKDLTGAALVKDNSGSSEMYGGDLREYGDFYDFHPYCDTPFYPVVLDSLLVGPRTKKPILLGEFNDMDSFRDLARLKRETPFWTSHDSTVNDQGVRWQHDLPTILDESRFAGLPEDTAWKLRQTSSLKSDLIRSYVQEAVRSRSDIAGYVITGWRDTPISTAGVVDDWLEPKSACSWNSPSILFSIPSRKPPWVHGGNRPGWVDSWCHFEGPVHLRLGAHLERSSTATLQWTLDRLDAGASNAVTRIQSGSCSEAIVEACIPTAVGEMAIEPLREGQYLFEADFGGNSFVHYLWVFPRPDFAAFPDWGVHDPEGHLDQVELTGGRNLVATAIPDDLERRLEKGSNAVVFLGGSATKPAPFWRECAHDWTPHAQEWKLPFMFEGLLSVSGDRTIDVASLRAILPSLGEVEVLFNRIDTRTFTEAPILIRGRVCSGTLVATTLRPWGGLGAQPLGVMNNPAGATLLASLIRLAEAP